MCNKFVDQLLPKLRIGKNTFFGHFLWSTSRTGKKKSQLHQATRSLITSFVDFEEKNEKNASFGSYDDCRSDDVTIFWLIFLTHFQNPI